MLCAELYRVGTVVAADTTGCFLIVSVNGSSRVDAHLTAKLVGSDFLLLLCLVRIM